MDQNLKVKTVKLLKENRRLSSKIVNRQKCLGKTQKAILLKIDKSDNQNENTCSSKDNIKKMYQEATNWERIFAKLYMTMDN